jgi:nicotinamidase-related amidase
VCCESTARNAMMLNYRSIMVHDALSAFTSQEHEFALQAWMLYFGDVLSSDEVIARL